MAVKTVSYKGYRVIQSGVNNHIMVADSSGKFVFHAQAEREFTENELKATVDNYLEMEKVLQKEMSSATEGESSHQN